MARAWQTVRVFISSTFRDMHAERDFLVRVALPELADRMRARGLTLMAVDLRWGVTDEQDALAVCLEEIDRARPRFVGLLGGRYGWVPEGRDRSITAMEIYHGVLDSPDQARHSFFYFREPEATASVPSAFAIDFSEGSGSEAEVRLRELKHDIIDGSLRLAGRPGAPASRASTPENRLLALEAEGIPLQVRLYPAAWDDRAAELTGLDELGRKIVEDLWASIDAEFPAEALDVVDPLEEEDEATEAFVQARARLFVGRDEDLRVLESFANADGPQASLCVLGEPGSGKSALLAFFSHRHTVTHPDHLVLFFAADATSRSTSAEWILRRACATLQRALDLPRDVRGEAGLLRQLLVELLTRLSSRRRVVLILDAIDQLDVDSRDLAWLPAPLPAGVRLLTSTVADAAVVGAHRLRHAPREHSLEPLVRDQREALLLAMLGESRRSLTAGHAAQLLSKREAGNPLYLTTAIEELAIVGRHERLADQIAALPDDLPELFRAVLERLEADHGAFLVGGAVAALAVSRGGLTQPELRELAAPAPGEPLPALQWARLYRAMRPLLQERGELLELSHRQVREAAVLRYLADDARRATAHGRLADLFGSLAPEYPRALQHLPFHLHEASRHAEVIRLMEGAFPGTKLARTGVAADVSQDYMLALRSCEYEGDFVGAVRFCLKRSSLGHLAHVLAVGQEAVRYSRIAGLLGDLDLVRRAAALVEETLADPAQRASVYFGLATALQPGTDRERLILRGEQLVSALDPVQRDSLAVLIPFGRALLHTGEPAIGKTVDLLRWSEKPETKRALHRLIGLCLWSLGRHSEAAEWFARAGDDDETLIEAAALLWHHDGDDRAAFDLLAFGHIQPERTGPNFPSLETFARVLSLHRQLAASLHKRWLRAASAFTGNGPDVWLLGRLLEGRPLGIHAARMARRFLRWPWLFIWSVGSSELGRLLVQLAPSLDWSREDDGEILLGAAESGPLPGARELVTRLPPSALRGKPLRVPEILAHLGDSGAARRALEQAAQWQPKPHRDWIRSAGSGMMKEEHGSWGRVWAISIIIFVAAVVPMIFGQIAYVLWTHWSDLDRWLQTLMLLFMLWGSFALRGVLSERSHTLLDWLGRRHPPALAGTLRFLLPEPPGSRPAGSRTLRVARMAAWVLSVLFVRRHLRGSRLWVLSDVAGHLKWLPAGDEKRRLVEETMEAPQGRDVDTMAVGVAEAAVALGEPALVRRAVDWCLDLASTAPDGGPSGSDGERKQREWRLRLRLDAASLLLAHSAEEGARLVNGIRTQEQAPLDRFSLRELCARTVDGAELAGRQRQTRFALLRLLSSERPSELPRPLGLVVSGAPGVSQQDLDLLDTVVEVPAKAMRGRVEFLVVALAAYAAALLLQLSLELFFGFDVIESFFGTYLNHPYISRPFAQGFGLSFLAASMFTYFPIILATILALLLLPLAGGAAWLFLTLLRWRWRTR